MAFLTEANAEDLKATVASSIQQDWYVKAKLCL